MKANLPVPYTPASFKFDNFEFFQMIRGKRILAYMLDAVLILFLSWWMSLLLLVFSFGTLWFLMPTLFVVIALAYHSLGIGGPSSATLGMRVFKVKVVRINGGKIDYTQAFIQVLLFYASISFFTPAILLVSLFNRQGRTLHEFLSGTVTLIWKRED